MDKLSPPYRVYTFTARRARATPAAANQRMRGTNVKTSRFGASLLFATALTASALAQGPTLVVTDSLRQMEFHDQITLIGRTEAIVSSRIVAEVSGRVESMDAAEGIRVRKGDPLITIDAERLQLSLASIEAQTSRARAQAELAQKDLSRAQDLFARSLIPESRMDSVSASARIATETYDQLQAERDQLALDLENCVIRAPFSGYTVRHLIDIGEWVETGSPVIEMVDLSKVKVFVDLPERHFGHLAVGSEVTVDLSNDPDRPLIGRVTGIAPSASEDTHTFPVIITADNRDGRIGGGMLVRVRLSLDDSFSSLAITKDAIVRQGNQTMVYTVVDGKAAPIPVTTSSTSGQMVAVTGQGLVAGMPVVVRGNERILPGSPVQIAGDTNPPATETTDSGGRSES